MSSINLVRECKYEHNFLQTSISLFIIFGMVLSYLPQHLKIIVNRSSDGISPYFLLLGLTSGLASLINILLNQLSVIQCCTSLAFGLCIESILGIVQIAAQWVLFGIVFILYYLYFPESRKIAQHLPHLHFSLPPVTPSQEWQTSLTVFYTTTVHFIITWSITLALVLAGEEYKSYLYDWASFNGVLSMILATVQYLPQILQTWHRKSCGALSIPMMLMQTPGAFLFAYSIASREGTNWTTWITYLVTGLLQGMLLILCIYFHWQHQRTKAQSYGPIYIGNVQGATSSTDGDQLNDLPNHSQNENENGSEELEPLLLNNHNLRANYDYKLKPHMRTKTLMERWKKGMAKDKMHLVHHSLASNLSETDDNLL